MLFRSEHLLDSFPESGRGLILNRCDENESYGLDQCHEVPFAIDEHDVCMHVLIA